MSIKIVVEKNIPFIQGVLDDMAQVEYLANDDITPQAMRDVDALICRTRTYCNDTLLHDSKCSFIATATIGTDHIDLNYCRNRGIEVANAPGCNAPAVAQYVFASLAQAIKRPIEDYTIGIVGVGHVGRIVEDWAHQLGMRVLVCDPPRAEVECTNNFVSLAEIAEQCDIITFHTPLTKEGKYPTHHICNASFLASLKHRPIVINCARGAIFDTQAVIDALDNGVVSNLIVDCWEGEPHLNADLLRKAVIATPHIAGYSREGKIRATAMALDSLARHFNLTIPSVAEGIPMGAAKSVTIQSIKESYNPLIDTRALKTSPQQFESLRNGYNYRDEVK